MHLSTQRIQPSYPRSGPGGKKLKQFLEGTTKQTTSSVSPSFEGIFTRFLRSEGAVKALWNEALKDRLEEFPRHFFTLCHSLSLSTFRLGFLSVSPHPFSLEECFPLETHFSFFLHTVGHSYLHSSIGTFVRYVDTNLLNNSSIFQSPSFIQELFLEMVDIILFSSVEISEQLAETYGDVFPRDEISRETRAVFFLKTFVSSFVCSCLEQPQVILKASLSPETLQLCVYFSRMLKEIVSFISLQHQSHINKEQQPQQKQPSPSPTLLSFLPEQLLNQVQRQLQILCSFILFEGGGGEKEGECDNGGGEILMKGYTQFFLPLWEDYHVPCKRDEEKGGRHTCSMKEPQLTESFLFIGEFLHEKMGEICKAIEGESKMGVWSLDVEAVRELADWMMKEENRETVRKMGEKIGVDLYDSPRIQTQFLNVPDLDNLPPLYLSDEESDEFPPL